MFEKLNKVIVCDFLLYAAGPVLVGSRSVSQSDPTRPDASFLVGMTEYGESYVIPGSTIKGVVRSRFEELFGGEAAGKLFGCIKDHKGQKSKISFHDAYADMDTVKTAIRTNTAIYSAVQAPKKNSLNNAQVIEAGGFNAGFRCVNYTDEEMIRLLSILEEVDIGLVRFGGRKSRGFGAMLIKDFKLTVKKIDSDLKEQKTVYDNILSAKESFFE